MTTWESEHGSRTLWLFAFLSSNDEEVLTSIDNAQRLIKIK